ncbi:MAG: NAD-dependent epimerase/dehydratase family protein [Candidatus Brockarchaeota archaeon]|nr:NAD-dependent epimerase/dehydratase family protein [Candidatus Brockarchaeota archaeon]
MKVLVTGGAGFVGKSLVKFLLDKGVEVRVLDKVSGNLEALKDPKLELRIGGVEDPKAVQSAMDGVDAVYHLAWSFSEKPPEAFNVDVGGQINLLEAAAQFNVKHFIFASSSVVYGKPIHVPMDEDHPCVPEDSRRPLFALTKLAAEKLCFIYYKERGLPYTVFRFWWAYGDDIRGGTLRALVDSALKGETINVPEKAGGSLVHVDDINQAFHSATFNEKAYGQVFNLTSGIFVTWRELVEIIIELTNSTSKMQFVPLERWTEPAFMGGVWEFKINKSERLIGFKPRYDVNETKRLLKKAIYRVVTARKEALSKT